MYHAQSRSYSSEARLRLATEAGRRLSAKHGQPLIDRSVAHCQHDRILQGIRARSRAMVARREWIARGRERYAGARLLFVLPVTLPGGGANVVIDEALAMRAMGVEVSIFNLLANRSAFERAYPAMSLPVCYGAPEDLGDVAAGYDAAIATFNTSVEWLAPLGGMARPPVRGYYVQGFEPLIYPEHLPDYRRALQSYTLFDDLVRFTKTEWTRRQVLKHTGADCAVIGPSVNIDLFRPRPVGTELRLERRCASPHGPRPALPAPVHHASSNGRRGAIGDAVEIVLFGTTLDDPELGRLPIASRGAWPVCSASARWRACSRGGHLCDFSSHQAMGLTALGHGLRRRDHRAARGGASRVHPSTTPTAWWWTPRPSGRAGAAAPPHRAPTCASASRRAIADVCELFPSGRLRHPEALLGWQGAHAMSPTRLHVVYDGATTSGPTAAPIRLLRPLSHPASGALTSPLVGTMTGQPVDAVIVDRLWLPDMWLGDDAAMAARPVTRRTPGRPLHLRPRRQPAGGAWPVRAANPRPPWWTIGCARRMASWSPPRRCAAVRAAEPRIAVVPNALMSASCPAVRLTQRATAWSSATWAPSPTMRTF